MLLALPHSSLEALSMPRLSFRAVQLLAFASAALFPARSLRAAPPRRTSPPAVTRELRNAFILSFRSPDLVTDHPDERWGRADDRLRPGMILTDLTPWLAWKMRDVKAARAAGRPILLALNVHSGFGTGLVTYTASLQRAQAVNYPWLARQLLKVGLNSPDVVVTIDTCNAQATAAHQLRPDLIPEGIAAFPPFRKWRSQYAERQQLPIGQAYRLYAIDRVREQLAPRYRRSRANVTAIPFEPLTEEERSKIAFRICGQKGVIVGTPAMFNMLRLGPQRLAGTDTADLLHDPLETVVLGDSSLPRNLREFRQYRDFVFLSQAGSRPVKPRAVAATKPKSVPAAKPPAPDSSRDQEPGAGDSTGAGDPAGTGSDE